MVVQRSIATNKPTLPAGVASLNDYKGPIAFAIPGNHDWCVHLRGGMARS